MFVAVKVGPLDHDQAKSLWPRAIESGVWSGDEDKKLFRTPAVGSCSFDRRPVWDCLNALKGALGACSLDHSFLPRTQDRRLFFSLSLFFAPCLSFLLLLNPFSFARPRIHNYHAFLQDPPRCAAEHSHQEILTSVNTSLRKNNPDKIVSSVFGLLAAAAAASGAGSITDTDCLQQATADQAFTNAKAANDVQGQVDALIYRALERNTHGVGTKSNACTSIKAVNPEIGALSQHQDPASDNAAAVNKAIVLTLAQQIAAVGGNPQDALKSGTFKPGNKSDKSGKANTCDDHNDKTGCIFTQNLLVDDATADEINAAVASVGGAASTATASA
uniref:Variant surface glycoprotein 1125 n=1 Tax=Mycena chlorophos TaxID=658473 RepID=A0ABQ0LVD7_MYCCL|nr:predicted protein [Mycena chlorophos]